MRCDWQLNVECIYDCFACLPTRYVAISRCTRRSPTPAVTHIEIVIALEIEIDVGRGRKTCRFDSIRLARNIKRRKRKKHKQKLAKTPTKQMSSLFKAKPTHAQITISI